MRKRARGFTGALLALALGGAWGRPAAAAEISPEGLRLEAALDSLDVESRWPAGVHVHWESGLPDGRPEHGSGRHTHCSAFVASAAKSLGVYILRPPEHSQELLANAQYDWLGGEGARQGWRPVDGAEEAQELANRGWLVVAAYRNHKDDKPGHVAVVRPSGKGRARVREEGPQVAQAGATNYRSTSLAQGFSGHPSAWKKHEVRFFAHPLAP
jgi:hypothetical protein